MLDDDIEQTLHVARSVSVYRIPPRPGASGWRSGEWLVSDKLFNGRLRIVSRGELCEVRIEDPNSGELFATCPVAYGQRNVAVEAVNDSSRYFVLRVEDASSGRHAFLGMGFDNRSDAFDFNEAMVRHEQQVARERAAHARTSGQSESCAQPSAVCNAPSPASPRGGHGAGGWAAGPSGATLGAANSAAAEVEVLYRQTADLRLQEGQTLRVNVSGFKKPGAAAGGKGGFLSSAVTTLLPPPPPSVSPASSWVRPAPSQALGSQSTPSPSTSRPNVLPPPLPSAPASQASPATLPPVHSPGEAVEQVGSQGNEQQHQLRPGEAAWAAQQCSFGHHTQPQAAALGQANWATFD